MDIDNNYYDDVNDNNVANYDYGYDEDYNDEGEYADVDGLLPEQFDPREDEEHNVDSDEEIRPAIDIEFDGTIVDDNEAHEINIPTSSPLDHLQHPLIYIFVFLVLFQINHISERIANTLISFISVLIGSFAGEEIRQCIPHSIAGMKKWFGLDYLTEDLQMYSACPTCHAIYLLPGPQNCTNPSRRMNGTLCDTPLLKSTASSNNRGNPYKKYAYYPLEDSLKRLFMRENFEEKTEQWKSRSMEPGLFNDVYNGMMWYDLFDPSTGLPFVETPRSLMLILNIDWFTPFDSGYSCGAIYLVCNNLPHVDHFKIENVILIGVMPGPKEPSTYEINSYLEPLVDSLLRLFNGITIPTYQESNGTLIRAALLNITCDIPTARKVGGFTSHNSTRACHKCTREFVVFPGTSNLDYSGNIIDREHGLRTREKRETGTRWSQIHRLPYFDLVCSVLIDPMHNLFLGTADQMVRIWREHGLLTDADRFDIQKLADGIVLPPGVPFLNRKIECKFGFMTAANWKAWCLVYSPFVLKNKLPAAHLNNWMNFADACRILSKTSITYQEIDDADRLLKEFVGRCCSLYGPECITPNMHLHLHLRETIEDFSTIYTYWLFSFERYNGFMKDAETNQKDSFELTFMKRFIEKTGALDFIRTRISSRLVGRPQELEVLLKIAGQSHTPYHQNQAQYNPLIFNQLSSDPTIDVIGSEPLPADTLLSMTEGQKTRFNGQSYELLLEHYQQHYDGVYSILQQTPGRICCYNEVEKFRSIEIFGQQYRSSSSKSIRGSHIQALFLQHGDIVAWTGQVQYYFRHVLVVDRVPKQHYFAYVRWYCTEAGQRFEQEGLEEWRNRFMADDRHSILPVHRISFQVTIVAYGP
ncbi:hypothetical protein INT45_008885 [Circinella minor]|uniref:Transposase domain-containing protein n=1 Tax=Circinella minor TaxID=1195481 RepID=A0A8H7RCU7_9FUNG|nr:hypothetical protein INT45_008885 [Circinella minor]